MPHKREIKETKFIAENKENTQVETALELVYVSSSHRRNFSMKEI